MAHPDLLVGVEKGDDAAVFRLGDEVAIVFTVDFFPPIVDDPFAFGAIAAANSFSDVYAMGGKPLLALNLTSFPADLPNEALITILQGGYAKAQEAQCLIVGGHTVDDPEPKYGLAVVGTVKPGTQVTNSGAKPGDRLVLTKPIGTGIITTEAKQGVVKAGVLERAISCMSTLNRAASEAMVKVGVDAGTDVTGFGLLGHLASMVEGSRVGARVHLSSVPVLEGAWELVEEGIAPGGTHRNLADVERLVRWHPDVAHNARILLCDAQTSGGLLIAVAEDRVTALLDELAAAGVEDSRVIGELVEDGPVGVEVLP